MPQIQNNNQERVSMTSEVGWSLKKNSRLWGQVASALSHPSVLLALVLMVAIVVRLLLLLPANLFITDEAYYLGAGVEIWMATLAAAKHYYQYTTGCIYIFPLAAAIAGAFFERFGIEGIVGVRLFNIAVNALTVAVVYQTARLLAYQWIESPEPRKWMPFFAGLIFGLSSCVLYVGTLGTYDAPSVAFFSIGIWRLMRAVFPSGKQIGSVQNFSRAGNAVAAGIALALSMMTRYFPIVFTPLIALIAIVSVVYFTYDRVRRKHFNKIAFLLIVFVLSFLIVFGGYCLWFYTAAIKPALGHNQANIEVLRTAPGLHLVIHVFDKYRLEAILAIVGSLELALPFVKKFFFGNKAFSDQEWQKRLFPMASFMLILIGGIAFQITGPHNYFAYTKNLAFPMLAIAPLAGFAAAKLMERFPSRIKWLFWSGFLCLLVGFAMRSYRLAKAHQIFGGLNNSDFSPFIAKQLSDPQFSQRYLQFQNEVAWKSHQLLWCLVIILVFWAVAFMLWNRRKNTILPR